MIRPSLQRKFPSLKISTVKDFLDRIQGCSVYSDSVPSSFVLDRDPKDSKYIDLAIAMKADFLVTRDKDLLDLRDVGQSALERIDAAVGAGDDTGILENSED